MSFAQPAPALVLDADGFASGDEPADVRKANALLRRGNDAVARVAAARTAVYWMAAFGLCAGAFVAFTIDPWVGGGNAAGSLLYLGCALFAPASPRSLLTAITVLYLGDVAYLFVTEDVNLWAAGIRLGILVVVAQGARATYRLATLRDELGRLGGAPSRTEPWGRLKRVTLYDA